MSESSGAEASDYGLHPKDTGSPEAQVTLITRRLETLTKHFDRHANDSHSRRGMMRMISQRKQLLEYLKRENIERYRAVISKLGLRK